MTRIALLPSSYPPSLGGVEELTRHLALALAGGGDHVEVWTGQPDDSMSETVEVRDELVVRRLPMPLPATNWSAVRRSATTGVRTLFSLRDAVAAFRPDVLHVQCFGPNGAYASALSRITGRPMVVTLQGETLMDDADIFETSRSLRASLRYALRQAAVVTACSSFTLDDAESRFGLNEGRGRVIPNGVDLTATPSAGPVRSGVLPDTPYILALGRVVAKKGFDLLLEAYAAMAGQFSAVGLVIAGTGAELEGLRRRAAELGVANRVRFVGRLDREEVAAAMADAEVFVMPSRLEPFGIVILEGWRAGTAVVATTRGGPPELVRDGQDGILVDPFDRRQLTGALERLLGDDRLRRSVADAGRARVTSFAWPVVVDRYRDVYASVTGTAVGGAPAEGRPRAAPRDDRARQGEAVG
ncbi:MAG TPA: glycosyltransferase family 4 protein [Acidimicrobiales bacterium]|nr:glycosyltransferase family 4 protein [Acidimicrobiales bacterium]